MNDDGHRFRSVTEWRASRFLTLLGIPWKHEPGKIDAGAGGYVPDFVATGTSLGGLEMEVKPSLRAVLDLPGVFAELRKPASLADWPQPVLVWFWDDRLGCLFDKGRGISGRVVRWSRCPDCNTPCLVGGDLLGLGGAYTDIGLLVGEWAYHDEVQTPFEFGSDLVYGDPCGSDGSGRTFQSLNKTYALSLGWSIS